MESQAEMTAAADTPDVPEPAGPPAVSRYEYTLLRLLRFTLGAVPADQARTSVHAEYTAPPPCLTRTCVTLAQDTLAKGVVGHLVRAGGWRRDRYLRRGEPADGRVWDRLPVELRRVEFSRHPLAFLMWLTSEKPAATKQNWDAPAAELTAADQVFFALVLDSVRAGLDDVLAVLVKKQAFAANPMCWLAAPGDFADADDPRPPTSPRASPATGRRTSNACNRGSPGGGPGPNARRARSPTGGGCAASAGPSGRR